MLTDELGRQFQYLRLSITDVCNFKCQYCLPNGYECESKSDFLTLNEIACLLQAFAELGLKKIRITGGEPTLRRDLVDIIQICKATPGIEQVAMTTNGYRLARHINEYVSAGLQSVNISLDSLDPANFIAITGYSNFAQVMQGVECSLEAGLKQVKLNAVLMKHFDGYQLDKTLAWLKSRNVAYRFIELMETGANRSFFNTHHQSGEAVKTELLARGWQRAIADKLAGPAQEFYHPDYAGRIGLIMPYSKDFCQSCNRLRVSSTGQLQMCLFAEAGIDLRAALREQNIAQTKAIILAAMRQKVEAHQLTQHNTGATVNFAQIGG